MQEIRIYPTNDGMEIGIKDGAIIEDNGMSTAVFMSLFTGPYWGNLIAGVPQYDSRIPEIRKAGGDIHAAALDIAAEARRVLSWLVTDGLASRVEVASDVYDHVEARIQITIERPEGQLRLGYGILWDNQTVFEVQE